MLQLSIYQEILFLVTKTQVFLIFLFYYFFMWTIFKVFIEFVTILLLLYVLVFWPRGMWDLSSLTRNWTRIPYIGRQSLNHWTTREVPFSYFWSYIFFKINFYWSIVDLQCCVSFCCIAKWISYTYTYIFTLY